LVGEVTLPTGKESTNLSRGRQLGEKAKGRVKGGAQLSEEKSQGDSSVSGDVQQWGASERSSLRLEKEENQK